MSIALYNINNGRVTSGSRLSSLKKTSKYIEQEGLLGCYVRAEFIFCLPLFWYICSVVEVLPLPLKEKYIYC